MWFWSLILYISVYFYVYYCSKLWLPIFWPIRNYTHFFFHHMKDPSIVSMLCKKIKIWLLGKLSMNFQSLEKNFGFFDIFSKFWFFSKNFLGHPLDPPRTPFYCLNNLGLWQSIWSPWLLFHFYPFLGDKTLNIHKSRMGGFGAKIFWGVIWGLLTYRLRNKWRRKNFGLV